MGWGLLSVHVIVLTPVVLSYHLRTSALLADFRLTFDLATRVTGEVYPTGASLRAEVRCEAQQTSVHRMKKTKSVHDVDSARRRED
jgi:hypothetical protein